VVHLSVEDFLELFTTIMVAYFFVLLGVVDERTALRLIYLDIIRNFVGAGIFGFLINLPIVSYYEIGTALTANHGHASMMGVYGMLAAGLALFALRYLIPEERWSKRAAKISFWALNLGLGWMVLVTLMPLGLLQLFEAVNHGYFEARQLSFVTSPTNRLLAWLRLPGDAVFIGIGVLPLLWLCWLGVRYRRPGAALTTTGALFTEVRRVKADADP
jgi:nitric oxide reductase subunit B